ncbi:MAG: SseB family protein [Agathobacter sp.]|jgi:hypothetical protein|nr:SseB family protein [Agathobacter sp.]
MIDKKKLSDAIKNSKDNPQKPPVDPNLTLDVKNEKLEELVKQYTDEKNADNLNALIEELRKCRLLVPANINEEKKPVPCMLNSKDKGMYFPVYTALKQIPQSPRSEAIINMPYLAVNGMTAQQQENLGGVAINPFTDNLIFKMPLVLRIQEVEKKRRELAKQGGEPKKKTLQLTPEQYLQFERRQFEFGFLPKRFFEQGQAFMDELCEKKEEYIDQLFEEAYQEKRRYPYLPEDFSVMVMNIAEDLLIVRVDLPAQDMAAPSCLRIYLAWNEVAGSGRYLTIETVKDSKERKLGELTLDWKKVDHGVAPVEGAELQYVIDLLQDKLS